MKNKNLSRMLATRSEPLSFDELATQSFCGRVPMTLVLHGHRPGTQTWKKLERVLDAKEMKVAREFALVSAVQRFLKSAGLYAGGVTGESSDLFVAALTAWQKKKRLESTGQLDEATLEKMDLYPREKKKALALSA